MHSSMLAVEYHPTTSLIPQSSNPRTHSAKQLKQIARSISEFGFTNPVLVDDEKNIIAGHGRVLAAADIGLENVPTIRLSGLTPAQIRAYVLADNKLALNAGWDQELLKIELGYLSLAEFDLSLTGFEMGEIDFLMLEGAKEAECPKVGSSAISKLGDVWMLGKHRLVCGNALDAGSFEVALQGRQADMVFTDPPYNVPIDGHVSGKGKKKHDEFLMASGEMTSAEFVTFLSTMIVNLTKFSKDGSIHYLCMDWRHIEELMHATTSYKELKNVCVWDKGTGGMGSLYRSQHELVFVFKHGNNPHTNNVMLGKNGRNRTNLWSYPGVNNWNNKERGEHLQMHPTVKPIQLIADAIQDCSCRNDIILDCFGGSGSTLMAAEQTGRIACLIELDPRYVDVIIRRFQTATGQTAHLESTGESFKQVSELRG